jgi:hypothetical protein
LATLSAVSDFWTSFFLGVRWGIGHSTGLLLVGVILIMRDYHRGHNDADPVDMPEWLGPFCESLVGVFMLFLGAYGFRRAWSKRHRYEGRTPIASSEEELGLDSKGISKFHHHSTWAYQDDPLANLSNIVSNEFSPQATSLELEPASTACHCGEHAHDCGSIFNLGRHFSVRSMAVFAGIIHGLAGPGGVLGVIPAVQLHDWKLATIYLGSFCLASTLTMGCFASCYGLLSSGLGRQTHLEFQIHCFSSSLSILVGITWLVLLSMGKLEDVFP